MKHQDKNINNNEESDTADLAAEYVRDLSQEEFRSNLMKKLRPVEPRQFHRQHEKLIDMISELYMLIRTMQRRRPTAEERQALFKMLGEFKQYAATHFREEERYMQQTNFPGVTDHQAAHARFVSKVLEVEERVRNESVSYVVELFFMVIDWLFSHINHMDRLYSDIHIKRWGPSKK
ncbi:MAG: hemerythrin family protein [Magnetococcales bacterium]|nr:hemerythrin family protein [Magnetococcales bacterium]